MARKRPSIATALLLLGLLAPAGRLAAQNPELVAPTGPLSPEDERKALRLPEGFEIQLVASEPAINKPMNIAFDDRGRLWVTSTVEYPYPAAEGSTPRDRVVILDDFGPDGRARKVSTFADGLNIPIGLLPIGGGREAFVHSIPSILRLTDDDGDGKADRRETVYSAFGFRDTHGMTNAFTIGFDGWLYACHGFSNTSEVKGADGRPLVMQSGNTYRMRFDGSTVEPYTRGQVNPFGLALDPLGNLYSSDCHTRPIYALLRGAYYPSFGKPHDGLGFGPEMMTHDHGSTGIAGITYYAADHFPPEYRDTLFIGNVVTSRVNRDRLDRKGSTALAVAEPDFIVSDDPWFRPVDVKLGPDGALYIADFYNKIIGHYEVPLTHPGRDRERGRIWRVVYKGKDGQAPPPRSPRADFTAASVGELVRDLAHPNLTVRMKATNQLSDRGGPEVIAAARASLAPAELPWPRIHALWVLDRLGLVDDGTLATLAADTDPAVRVHALKALADRRPLSSEARGLALAGLTDADAFARRASAEALGQHPGVDNLRPLLDARRAAPADDTHLVHVIRMALRDQLVPAETWDDLGRLTLDERDRRDLADVATGVPSSRAAGFLLAHLESVAEPAENQARYAHHVARHGEGDAPGRLLALARKAEGAGLQVAWLKAIAQGTQERGAPLADEARRWAIELTDRLLKSADDVGAGVDLASTFKLAESVAPLATLAVAAEASEANRGAAVDALAAIDPSAAVAPLGRVVADAGSAVGLRERAAAALARTNQPGARDALLASLATAPGRLQGVIATGLAGTPEGAEALLSAVEAGKASARLLQERGVEVRLGGVRVAHKDERMRKLLAGLPPADARIQELIAARRDRFAEARAGADAGRGQQVFAKNCAGCHQIGGQGAKVGPQLDGVGLRGVDRLLEDVLDPNRNVDQAFRNTTLALDGGQVVSGLLLREEGEVLVMADAQGKEVRIPKASVEEQAVTALSPMPANWADQIPEPEFADLLAYLIGQRPADQPAKP